MHNPALRIFENFSRGIQGSVIMLKIQAGRVYLHATVCTGVGLGMLNAQAGPHSFILACASLLAQVWCPP